MNENNQAEEVKVEVEVEADSPSEAAEKAVKPSLWKRGLEQLKKLGGKLIAKLPLKGEMVLVAPKGEGLYNCKIVSFRGEFRLAAIIAMAEATEEGIQIVKRTDTQYDLVKDQKVLLSAVKA